MAALPCQTSEHGPAFGAAESLLAVHRAAESALDGHRLPTLDAVHLPRGVRQSLGLAGTLTRAVRRILVELLSVFGQVGRLKGERAAAMLTGEGRHLGEGRWSAVQFLMLHLARLAAKLSVPLAASRYGELFSAMLAGFLVVMSKAMRVSAFHSAKLLVRFCGAYRKALSAMQTVLGNRHFSLLRVVATGGVCLDGMSLSTSLGDK